MGGGIDTAPIEFINIGRRKRGMITEVQIPAPYNDSRKYALINCFLKNAHDHDNRIYFDTANTWQQLQVLEQSIVHIYFAQDGAYEGWDVYIIVARIG